MEKKVIIEEIGMYDDQPMWSAYDHAKQASTSPTIRWATASWAPPDEHHAP